MLPECLWWYGYYQVNDFYPKTCPTTHDAKIWEEAPSLLLASSKVTSNLSQFQASSAVPAKWTLWFLGTFVESFFESFSLNSFNHNFHPKRLKCMALGYQLWHVHATVSSLVVHLTWSWCQHVGPKRQHWCELCKTGARAMACMAVTAFSCFTTAFTIFSFSWKGCRKRKGNIRFTGGMCGKVASLWGICMRKPLPWVKSKRSAGTFRGDQPSPVVRNWW